MVFFFEMCGKVQGVARKKLTVIKSMDLVTY